MSTRNIYDVVHKIHVNELKHGGYKKVLDQVEQRYFGVPRSYVQEFCRTCPTCQLRTPQTSRAPLKPIIESEFLSRVQVDLIDMRNTPDGPYNYICHFVDHFTKFHILFPLQDKTAESVRQHPHYYTFVDLPRIFVTGCHMNNPKLVCICR